MDILRSGTTMDLRTWRRPILRRFMIHLVAAVISVTLCAPASVAQLSPGDLSEAHAQLEGMSNCTSCHTIGKTISNDKCIACHTDIRSRIESGKGSHGRLGGKPCVECHKEHHGRTFSIVHFETSSFDHGARTGFPLQGRHARLNCRECHKQEFVKDPAVRKRGERALAKTYEGLSPACANCHKDNHRGQFSGECTTCHTMDHWKPAQRFDHAQSRFKLAGEHVNVACAKCHTASAEQPTLVRYRNIPFGACSDCHRDPHAGRFKQACASCHTSQGWKLAGSSFDHATTRFPLRGKHALLKCQRCHGGKSEGEAGRGFHVTKFQRCSDCHADPHRGRFTRQGSGKSCESCHSESGWRGGPMAAFDHSKTAFPLKGRHKSIDCTKCHGGKEAFPLAVRAVETGKTTRCSDCHTDPHAGQFPSSTDCASCHVETGFLPSLFSIEKHRSARFAVDGSHEAVPCIRCHTAAQVDGRKVRQFRFSTTRRCADCHNDPHGGELTRRPGRVCESCHSSATWASLRFAHEQTEFVLDGKHRSVPCGRCHRMIETSSGLNGWKFAGIPKTCAGCHGNSKTDSKTGQQRGARP